MKNGISTLALFIAISIFGLVNFQARVSYAEENEDAFLAILALNYCHMSLYKITEYNDRVVLDEEYSNIINNINLSKIKDPELINILKQLMDVLTEFKLDERSKEKLLKQYEKNVEGALYSSMAEGARSISAPVDNKALMEAIAQKAAATAATGGVAAAASGPGAPVVAAATCAVVLVQAGSAYVSYRNAMKEYRAALDEAVWKLDDNAIKRINEINKTFLETYWKLMTKYKAPDKWRLTLGQFKDYFAIVKDEDEGRKYRNLVRLETDLGLFPPYWYFRGAAAQKIGKKGDVLNCYAMYEKMRKGFFRQDKTYSSVVMLKIVETDYRDDLEALSGDLTNVVNQDRKDWRKRLFCAYKLIEYGQFQKAREQVQANIDSRRAVSVSRKALGDIYYLQNDKAHLEQLIDKTISDDTATNQEVLYLIGKLPAEKMVEKIKDQIVNINCKIDKHLLGKDDLILRIPAKWILDDPENLSVKLLVNEKKYIPKETKADKETKEMIFTFEDALDATDLLEGNKALPMAFSLNTQTGNVAFLTELRPTVILVDKGYTDKSVDMAKSATDGLLKYVRKNEKKPSEAEGSNNASDKKQENKKEEKVLKFVLKNIRYLDSCFVISEDNQITKCPAEEMLTIN
jgi:hypothetical protein